MEKSVGSEPVDDFIEISSDGEVTESIQETEGVVNEKEEGEASEGEIEKKDEVNQVETEEFPVQKSSFEKNVESVMILEHATITKTKRSRIPEDGQEKPSVHVVYKSLSGASRKKLEELLQQWSEWHAKNVPPLNNSTEEESLEDGEESYFPVLFGEKSTFVSVRVDKRARSEGASGLESESTPLYDRGFSLGVSSVERVESEEASRCFNCGSYSHSLKECPRPRDAAAIALARGQHSVKKSSVSGSRSHSRYYQSSGGKFDDLRPGFLSPELRKSLGIGEHDPPPWLNRMRELGYPPGYLEEGDEHGPSGITIFAEEEEKLESEEGELPEKGKRMAVDFPGVNAPIPDKADRRVWAMAPNSPASRRRSPRRYNDHDSRVSLSRTPSFGERERERGLPPLNGSPYPGNNMFSDRWMGSAADPHHGHRQHHHHHHRHHHHR